MSSADGELTLSVQQERRVVQQAGVIPFRRWEDEIEYCLITASTGRRWGFPKGVIDPGETYLETALKEADEEAGLHGRIIGDPIGEYQYEKWKSPLNVIVVIMEVTHSGETWDEAAIRDRRWVSYEEALELLAQPEQTRLLKIAHEEICDSDE